MVWSKVDPITGTSSRVTVSLTWSVDVNVDETIIRLLERRTTRTSSVLTAMTHFFVFNRQTYNSKKKQLRQVHLKKKSDIWISKRTGNHILLLRLAWVRKEQEMFYIFEAIIKSCDSIWLAKMAARGWVECLFYVVGSSYLVNLWTFKNAQLTFRICFNGKI